MDLIFGYATCRASNSHLAFTDNNNGLGIDPRTFFILSLATNILVTILTGDPPNFYHVVSS